MLACAILWPKIFERLSDTRLDGSRSLASLGNVGNVLSGDTFASHGCIHRLFDGWCRSRGWWSTIVFVLNDLHNLASSVALLGICNCSFVGPLCFNEYLERNYGVVEKICVLLMMHPSILDDIFKLSRKMNDEKLIEYQG